MADQRLLGWSAGLAVAGFIGLAMSGTSSAQQPTTSNSYPSYTNSPPTYSYTTPTYTYSPPSYTYSPPTYAYTPTYEAPAPQAPARQYVPAPVVQEPQQQSAYYKNCAAARAAGAAPMRTGDPGYRSALDRDGDGIACE